MKSWREKGLEETEKQRQLDEIHQKPNVKKTFVVCEIFLTIDWISNIAFFVLLLVGSLTNKLLDAIEMTDAIYILLDAIGGYGVVVAFVVIKIIIGRFKKRQRTKLQVLEDAGLEEIKQAKEAGTYKEGPKASLLYRIYRAIRTWSTIIVVFGALFALLRFAL